MMIIEKITSPGIAHHSYFIGSNGEAAVIDPRRDCDIYLDIARSRDMRITGIFETHRNEDYCTGSLELAERCGAGIYHGEKTAFLYGHPVRHGDHFPIGETDLEVIETPGHTRESISLLLRERDSEGQVLMVFTGDTLFAGDVGRTDLMGMPRADSAALLYDSIMQRILPLGDHVIICPAHGSGSVCGSRISDRGETTIGYEKVANVQLQMEREAFIARISREQYYQPPYFRTMEVLNQEGPTLIHHLPDLTPFRPDELEQMKEVQIVDIRSPTGFGGGHIPGALSIWRDGLGAFMGWFLDYDRPIVLVDDCNESLDEVVREFVRLAYDNTAGYLAGGFPAWFKAAKPVSRTGTWSVHELNDHITDPLIFLLDVRDIHNREKVGHIRGSHHIYIGELPGRLEEVPRERHVVAYCDAGYKGSLAVSLLSRAGYSHVTNLLGGMTGWIQAGFSRDR
jgi:hydroxyacylglutathione hydrolase